MKRTLIITSFIAAVSSGHMLFAQAPELDRQPYRQEVVDAAMAKLRANQALRAAEEAALPPEQRAAEQEQRQQQDELMRLRRESHLLQNENEQLRRQVSLLSREVQEMRQSMQQLGAAVEQARRLAMAQREPAPDSYDERYYIYDRYWPRDRVISPLTVPPPEGFVPIFPEGPRPAPGNALNPNLTPRNTLDPQRTPRNTLNPQRTPPNTSAPVNRSLNPAQTPRNTMNPGGPTSGGRE
jgi:hypothetical protein